MKTAVSLPDDIFLGAENLAKQLGYTRSELYARALREYLQGRIADPVTEKLNRIAANTSQSPTPHTSARELIETGAWEW